MQYPPSKCDVPKGKNQGDSGLENDLGRILVLAFQSIAQCGSLKETFGGVIELGWGTIMHDSVEYPVTLAKCAPKMLLSSTSEHMGLQNSPQQYQPKH
jgi:hypothetical protein